MTINEYKSGWICLNKPAGMSSNQAMIKVKKIFKQKTGYIGTLDPFATGVLPIAIGEACKFIPYISDVEKTYILTMVFGQETDTLDTDGKIIKTSKKIPNDKEISVILPSFLGEIMQRPPSFSAIKIRGKRACDRVRNGEIVELPLRKVNIFSVSLLATEGNEATLSVICSKGTYIRSLARDIAEKLGSVAYVKSLKRIKSGFFSINHAISLEKISQIKDTNDSLAILASVESPLDDIPALYMSEENIVKLQNGVHIKCENLEHISRNVRIFGSFKKKFSGIGFISEDSTLVPVRMCRLDRINYGEYRCR